MNIKKDWNKFNNNQSTEIEQISALLVYIPAVIRIMNCMVGYCCYCRLSLKLRFKDKNDGDDIVLFVNDNERF